MKKNNHKKVLNWVNKERNKLGLKSITSLPKGIVGDASSCPIANAFADKRFLDVQVGQDVTLEIEIEVPKAVQDFAKKINSKDDDINLGLSLLLDKTVTSIETIDIPGYVSKFISDFDEEIYPELLEG